MKKGPKQPTGWGILQSSCVWFLRNQLDDDFEGPNPKNRFVVGAVFFVERGNQEAEPTHVGGRTEILMSLLPYKFTEGMGPKPILCRLGNSIWWTQAFSLRSILLYRVMLAAL